MFWLHQWNHKQLSKLEQILTKIKCIQAWVGYNLNPQVLPLQKNPKLISTMMLNVSWRNICTTNDLYSAKIHLSKYNIKIQCVLIVHKISMVEFKLGIQPTYKISPKDV